MLSFLSAILVCCFGLSHGRQLSTVGGDSLWIATVDDDFDCDAMTQTIKDLTENHSDRRLLAEDKVVIVEMKGDDDCFIEFSGTPSMANVVNNTVGIIDVDPNNEIVINWHLDRSDQQSLPLDGAPYAPIYTGAGQRVYIIDTGVFTMHDDFGGRATMGLDLVEEYLGPFDNNGHGTHCSSIAAGANHGIAPNADIVGVKVLGSGGSGATSDVIQGIQWAVKHAGRKTSVISLSLGGPKSSSLDKAVVSASGKHIVVVAAGNSNSDACKSSPSGASGDVITVGSTTNTDSKSDFSSYGPCVDIFGPGSNIVAAFIGGTSATKSLSGTSMATPYIAGIALQLLEKNGGDLKSTHQEIFNTAVYGKLNGNIGLDSPNLLGLIPTYTGPPTLPTISPTKQPTLPDPKLCTGTKCVEFKASTFGQKSYYEKDLQYDIGIPTGGDMRMCAPTKDDFKNKVVVVERGGCLFFDKVKNCEKQGAKAVLISNDSNSVIFEPGYYGTETTNIPSCMISKRDGNELKTMVGQSLIWGRFAYPTRVPTTMPTGQIRQCDTFGKRGCNRKKRCKWQRSTKLCLNRN